MHLTRNARIILLAVLFPDVLAGWGASDLSAYHITVVSSSVSHELRVQDEKERPCRTFARLHPQQLLGLVTKRIPLAPPAMLDNSRLHGRVTVQVSIDDTGKVASVEGVKGNPFAISSAVESVRTWTFMPYRQNGEAKCAVGLITLSYDFRSMKEDHR